MASRHSCDFIELMCCITFPAILIFSLDICLANSSPSGGGRHCWRVKLFAIVQQTRDRARRGDPRAQTTCRITRTTVRSTASPLLIIISCCGRHAPGHPGAAIRLLSLRLQFPALHMFAQGKAGGWGGGGRERPGTEHCTSLSKRPRWRAGQVFQCSFSHPKALVSRAVGWCSRGKEQVAGRKWGMKWSSSFPAPCFLAKASEKVAPHNASGHFTPISACTNALLLPSTPAPRDLCQCHHLGRAEEEAEVKASALQPSVLLLSCQQSRTATQPWHKCV